MIEFDDKLKPIDLLTYFISLKTFNQPDDGVINHILF